MILLVKSYSRPDKNEIAGREKNEVGPLGELLQETANHPIVQKVSQVYIGNSYDMRLARLLILKASQSKSNVLILGETGTGKDVIAKQIAENSIHYKKSFLHFHCAGLSEELLESELFGHMKGAFTGAICNKEGIFVAKKNGTIFLDEFGDLSLTNQVKLLLAIDSKIVRPIGSNDNIPIDVRILAATSRNVDYMAMNGLFREDLLFRLNDFRITAPSLRTHPEDIPEIAIHLWKKIHPDGELSMDFLNYLKSFPWSGNVRELRSMLTKISDIFGNISPTRKHIDDIRKARLENLQNNMNNPPDDTKQLLKLDTTLKLTELLNIVRGIKVAMRPVINNELTPANFEELSEKIKQHIDSQIRLIDNICLHPLNLKDYELFNKTIRYRYLLD
jgi:transcriptional regulator with PAS, ATPase and Fis domain